MKAKPSARNQISMNSRCCAHQGEPRPFFTAHLHEGEHTNTALCWTGGADSALQSCMAWSVRSVATGAAMAALGMAAAARPIHRIRQARRLEAIIGDFRGFIDALHGHLLSVGIDAPRLGYEMDHICYRVDTKARYHQVLAAIVPEFGCCLVESMIGGRLS